MGLPRRSSLLQYLFLLLLPLAEASTTTVITLYDFQQINGFSSTCTTAYNTPIVGCTTADFLNNAPCSSACISGLESVANLVDAACQGTSASPSTLIGLIFQGKGVAALCPNGQGGTTPQATQRAGSTSSPTFETSSAAAASAVSSTTVSPSPSAASSTTFTISTPSINPTSTPSPVSSNVVSVPSNSVASSSNTAATTAATAASANSNPDQFSGGGSPFDISNAGSQSSPNCFGMSLGAFVLVISLYLL